MSSDEPPKQKPFTIFSSAAEEAATKAAADDAATKSSKETGWHNEGGHMSGTSGRVKHEFGSALPFVVRLTHQDSDTTEHRFATMREAEAFIKRNTPVARAVLSTTYDRPASEPRALLADELGSPNDDDIVARLRVVIRRLRQISIEDAASVLARSLPNAGIDRHERMRLIAKMERILDELDGKTGS